MQYFIRIMCIIVMLLLSTTLKSQTILSHTLLPSNPNSNEMISLSLQTGFNYSNCSLTNYFVSMNGNTISVVANYQIGILTVLCDRTDILFISNSLPAGTFIVNISTFVNGPLSGTDNASFSFNVNNQIDLCSGVNIDDGNPCTIDACNPATGVISHTDDSPLVTATAGSILCNGGTTCITVTASGGQSPYTGTGEFCGYIAGSYTLEVTDDRSCKVTSSLIDITEPAKLSVTLTSTPSTGSDGTATAIPSGGTPDYTYLWTPGGQTTNIAVGLAPISYCVKVTDANGCTATSCIVTTPPCDLTAPGPIIGPNGVCSKQTSVFCVTPNILANTNSYIWSPLPAGVSVVGSSNGPCATLKFSTKFKGGFICAKALTTCGTTASACLNVVLVTSNPPTPGNIAGPSSLCSNETATYTISAVPYVNGYLWSFSGNMQILSGQGTTSIVVKALSNFNGGAIKVKSVNCKGKSGERRLNISKATGCRSNVHSAIDQSVISKEIPSTVSLFPNPTLGKLTVSFYSESKTKFKFEVIDLLGNTIWDDFVDAFEGENTIDLNLNKVAKGMYFLTLKGADMKVQTLRIVVE